MKRNLPSTLLVLTLFALPSLPAAETKVTPPPGAGNAEVKPALAGEYAGSWKGSNDVTGALRIRLRQDGAGWVAEAWFTYEGAEVSTKMKSVQVDGSKVEMVFGWEVQGTAAQSKLNGDWTGDKLVGRYESTSAEGAAQGTWTVTRT